MCGEKECARCCVEPVVVLKITGADVENTVVAREPSSAIPAHQSS